MFRTPFDWRTRRNLLEAIGFYLIYVALGAAAVTFIVGISIIVSLYGDMAASHTFAAWMPMTVMVTYYAVVSGGIMWRKQLQHQWFGVAAGWVGVLVILAPHSSGVAAFYVLLLGMILPAVLTTWNGRKKSSKKAKKKAHKKTSMPTHD